MDSMCTFISKDFHISLTMMYMYFGLMCLNIHVHVSSMHSSRSQGKLTISLPDGQDVQGDKSGIFRMVFWLNAYHKFFCEKVPSLMLNKCSFPKLLNHFFVLFHIQRPSPHLAEMLRNKDHLLYVVQPPEINRLIQCFLDPSLMSQEQGSTQGDSSMFQDPVYMLFHPEKNEDSKC